MAARKKSKTARDPSPKKKRAPRKKGNGVHCRPYASIVTSVFLNAGVFDCASATFGTRTFASG